MCNFKEWDANMLFSAFKQNTSFFSVENITSPLFQTLAYSLAQKLKHFVKTCHAL